MMFTAQFGLLWVFLSCFYSKSEAKLSIEDRTSIALVGKSVVHKLQITIPANSSTNHIYCYHNSHQVWKQSIDPNTNSIPVIKNVVANITMHNSSCSGEYYFMYMDEKLYWVVLVRDVGLPDSANQSFLIPMLVVIIVLLLLSITGSVYIFKWYKNQSSSGGDEEKRKKKRERNTVAKREEATSESVYTALDQRTVSVYDVLNVDELRRASTEGQSTQKKAKTSPVEEGIFESVYENL